MSIQPNSFPIQFHLICYWKSFYNNVIYLGDFSFNESNITIIEGLKWHIKNNFYANISLYRYFAKKLQMTKFTKNLEGSNNHAICFQKKLSCFEY